MNFITLKFCLFFLIILPFLFYLRKRTSLYIPALIVCNLLFYMQSGLIALCTLVVISYLVYCSGKIINSPRKIISRCATALSVFCCVFILCVFKYYNFFLENLNYIFHGLSVEKYIDYLLNFNIVYVAGISFFIFQAISYLIDVRDKKIEPQPFSYVLAYLSFFPTIMSGPIIRANTFINQISNTQPKIEYLEGLCLILSGLFKKVVIASYISAAIKPVFISPDSYNSLSVLIAMYGYSAEIFCDFSGYTDIAIGIGKIIGFELPQNFNRPYLAVNIQDFWRRWHITLSSWLKDYLYIQLGGNRRGNLYINLMLTMIIGGLWHGSAWNFLIWGTLHGLALVIHRLYIKNVSKDFLDRIKDSRAIRFLSIFLTFHIVTFFWVFFRTESTDQAVSIFIQIFSFDLSGLGINCFVVLGIISCFLLQLFGKFIYDFAISNLSSIPWILHGVIIGIIAAIIMKMGPTGVLPFIYYGF